MIPETVQAPRVVREDGRTPFRAPQAGVDPVGDQDLVTKGWAEENLGGSGAPADATYIVRFGNGSLSAERELTNSFAIEWDWLTPGVVTANLGSGVLPAVLGAVAGYFSPLGHTHDATEIVSGLMAVARLGTGSPSSSTYLRGDGVWSATAAFAAASHTHAASDITSGTIATARLGSGTASSTTFLRGDQSYSTIPTGAIDADAITDAKLRNSAALSVIGRSANSSGDPADIAAGTDGHVLRRSGTTLGFGTIATAGITDAAVTDAKLRNSAALSVIGRGANSSGAPADIAASSDGGVLRRKGTALAFGQILASAVDISTAGWSGFLDSARVAGLRNLQELLDHIDANGLDAP
mgnify:CR=1 FL=1